MTPLNPPERFYTADKARQMAAELQAGDPDWTYTVVTSSATGWSWIVVKDDAGEIVAEKI